ncbi:uncharacterized protein LOC110070732 [Pogona vitticeps]
MENISQHNIGFLDIAIKPEKEEGFCNQGSEESRDAALCQSGFLDVVIKPEEEEQTCKQESVESASVSWDQAEFPEIVVKLEEEEHQDTPRVEERTSIAADQSGDETSRSLMATCCHFPPSMQEFLTLS